MSGTGAQLALIGFLILINAAFAGTEIALITLREGQLDRLERHSASGRALARLARDPNRFLSTIQIGITLAGFLASATAAVALADELVGPLAFLGRAARPVAVFAITLVLTMVTLVIGELAPKRMALQRAERWGLLAARPLSGLAAVAAPVVWLLSRATDVVVRLAGGDPARHRPDVTEEEIRDMVAAQPSYTSEQRQVIDGALEVAGRTLRHVLRPRSAVIALRADLSVEEALQKLVAAGHSRAPVYTRDLDDADRVVSVLGMVGRMGVAGDHARRALVLPESLNAVTALRELQSARQQMALVVSEYGAVEGVVTVEDIVEELVGEIYDEHDRDVSAVVHEPDGTLVVPGTFPVHDLVDLGLSQPDSGEVTVAGMVAERLGRIPILGDRVEVDGVTYEVQEMRGHAATRIHIQPADPPLDDPTAVTDGD